MLAILLSGLVSAQDFEFGCGTVVDRSTPDGTIDGISIFKGSCFPSFCIFSINFNDTDSNTNRLHREQPVNGGAYSRVINQLRLGETTFVEDNIVVQINIGDSGNSFEINTPRQPVFVDGVNHVIESNNIHLQGDTYRIDNSIGTFQTNKLDEMLGWLNQRI